MEMDIKFTYMQVFIKWREVGAKASQEAKVYDMNYFAFANQGAIECTIGFRIASSCKCFENRRVNLGPCFSRG
jgi:hypothetical protein